MDTEEPSPHELIDADFESREEVTEPGIGSAASDVTSPEPARSEVGPDETVSEGEERAADELSSDPTASIDAVEQLLDEVEAALSRLDDETYGQCGSCGERIDDGLLAEAPTRRTCEACASTVVA